MHTWLVRERVRVYKLYSIISDVAYNNACCGHVCIGWYYFFSGIYIFIYVQYIGINVL